MHGDILAYLRRGQHQKAVEAQARQPEMAGKIQTTLILGAALSEATAIYGLIGAILIIFMVK